jgi:hypothetical protein
MAPIPSQAVTSVPIDSQPPTLNERERKLWQDHEWILHDPDLQRAFAGSVVAVSNRIILGNGRTHQAALDAALARPDCPPRDEIVTVAVEGQPLAVALAPVVKERQ